MPIKYNQNCTNQTFLYKRILINAWFIKKDDGNWKGMGYKDNTD